MVKEFDSLCVCDVCAHKNPRTQSTISELLSDSAIFIYAVAFAGFTVMKQICRRLNVGAALQFEGKNFNSHNVSVTAD